MIFCTNDEHRTFIAQFDTPPRRVDEIHLIKPIDPRPVARRAGKLD